MPVGAVVSEGKPQRVQLAGPLVPVQPGRGTTADAGTPQAAAVQPLPPVEVPQKEPSRFPWPQEPIPVYPQTPY